RRYPVHPIDRQLGIETSTHVNRLAASSGSEADKFSVPYSGSHPSIMRQCLDLIGSGPEAAFIDLGSGKGRMLAVAAEYPFAVVKGIELAPYTCAVARKNVEILKARSAIY